MWDREIHCLSYRRMEERCSSMEEEHSADILSVKRTTGLIRGGSRFPVFVVARFSEIGCSGADARASGSHRRIDGDSGELPRRDIMDRTGSRVGCLGKSGKAGTRKEDHGSKNSTMPGFLAAVQPSVAVISAGEDNPYGHPHLELLERLETAGVRILRTDREGAVHILTDGERLEISCFVACPETTVKAASAQSKPPYQQKHGEQ